MVAIKNLIFVFIIIIFTLIQTTILYNINIFNAKPDLLLISVLIASFFFKSRSAIFLSIFAGILKDIFCLNTFGINTLLFTTWNILIVKLSKKISLDNIYIRMALIFIIANLNDIAGILIFSFLGNFIYPHTYTLGAGVYWGIFLRTAFIGSLYTAFVFPLVLKIINPIFTIVNKRSQIPSAY